MTDAKSPQDSTPKTESNTQPSSPASATAAPEASKGFAHGLVTVKLLETRNLKMPAECPVIPGGPTGKDVGLMPFAVIEMDKNEVIMRAIEANPSANTVTFGTKTNL